MSRRRSESILPRARSKRRVFTEEFKREAVQMLLDGHRASSVAERLGLAGPNLLYRWKQEQLEQTGPIGTSLEARVRELEAESAPRRTRTRHFKKSAGYFRPARITEVYAAVSAITVSDVASVANACEVLDVSRSAYYVWRQAEPAERERRDQELTPWTINRVRTIYLLATALGSPA